MSDNYKKGVVRLIRNNLLKVERKDGTFFVIVEQVGFNPPKVQPKEVLWDLKICTIWDNVEPDGLSATGLRQYKVLPAPMKGDTHQDLNKGESQISTVICDKKEVVDVLVLSLDHRVRVACAAAKACQSEGEDFDFWVDQITTSIRNMNKVSE